MTFVSKFYLLFFEPMDLMNFPASGRASDPEDVQFTDVTSQPRAPSETVRIYLVLTVSPEIPHRMPLFHHRCYLCRFQSFLSFPNRVRILEMLIEFCMVKNGCVSLFLNPVLSHENGFPVHSRDASNFTVGCSVSSQPSA